MRIVDCRPVLSPVEGLQIVDYGLPIRDRRVWMADRAYRVADDD